MRKEVTMDIKDLLEKLNAIMEKYGPTQAGNLLGYDGSFLQRVIAGKRPMPDGLIEALGYEKIVKYRKIK